MCDRIVIGVAKTLEEAAKLRQVSGDLVTLHGLVVDSEEWLFPWEKTDPNCYAKKAIEAVDVADWGSETPREEGNYSLKIAPERQDGSIFAGGNDKEELVVEIVYPVGSGLPLGKGRDGTPFHLGENKLIGAKWRKRPKSESF
jgi:hypothetical protein